MKTMCFLIKYTKWQKQDWKNEIDMIFNESENIPE